MRRRCDAFSCKLLPGRGLGVYWMGPQRTPHFIGLLVDVRRSRSSKKYPAATRWNLVLRWGSASECEPMAITDSEAEFFQEMVAQVRNLAPDGCTLAQAELTADPLGVWLEEQRPL